MYNTPNILGGNLFKVSWLANCQRVPLSALKYRKTTEFTIFLDCLI